MSSARALVHASAVVALCGFGSISPGLAQTVLGTTKHMLDGSRASICARETALGNAIANALKEELAADIAIINCGAISGNLTFLPGASISDADAARVLPAEKAQVVEVSGLDLLTVLEQAFSTVGVDDGRFPQVAGLRVQIDPDRPAGLRVVRVTVNGEALDVMRAYRVATTGSLAAGQLGYSQLAAAKPVTAADKALPVSDVFADYVRKEGILDVKAWGRIRMAE